MITLMTMTTGSAVRLALAGRIAVTREREQHCASLSLADRIFLYKCRHNESLV